MKIPEFVMEYLDNKEEIVQVSDHIFGVRRNIIESGVPFSGSQKAVIVSGLSGSGKDSIVDKIVMSGKKLSKVRTCTTRERRPEESEVSDPYIRISKIELDSMIKEGVALECTEYAGNYYCTSKHEIEEIVNSGQVPVLRIDPPGANFFLSSRDKGHEYLKNFIFNYLFVVPTSFEDLKDRLRLRGSNEELVAQRITQSEKDITYIGRSHYIVVNEYGSLDTVVGEVLELLG